MSNLSMTINDFHSLSLLLNSFNIPLTSKSEPKTSKAKRNPNDKALRKVC